MGEGEVDETCAPGCSSDMIGDGNCDVECISVDCLQDNGDCDVQISEGEWTPCKSDQDCEETFTAEMMQNLRCRMDCFNSGKCAWIDDDSGCEWTRQDERECKRVLQSARYQMLPGFEYCTDDVCEVDGYRRSSASWSFFFMLMMVLSFMVFSCRYCAARSTMPQRMPTMMHHAPQQSQLSSAYGPIESQPIIVDGRPMVFASPILPNDAGHLNATSLPDPAALQPGMQLPVVQSMSMPPPAVSSYVATAVAVNDAQSSVNVPVANVVPTLPTGAAGAGVQDSS